MTTRPARLSENDEDVLEAYIRGLLLVNQLLGDKPEGVEASMKVLEQEGISAARVRELATSHRRHAVQFVLEKMGVVSLPDEDAEECERLLQDETIERYMLERLADYEISKLDLMINGTVVREDPKDSEAKTRKGGRG